MTEINQCEILKNVQPPASKFLFPRWANYLVPAGVLLAIGVLTYVPVLLSLGLSPLTLDVGYKPVQPIPFSHKLHAGDLQIDCRYCHSTVEKTAFAAIPPTQVCMNCHAAVKSESGLLAKMRTSYSEGSPIEWIKIHDLPDFVYFNHSAHINKGVACVTCHGRIDQMEEVYQSEPISMGWCLNCHRQPERYLRPRDQITQMDWDALRATGKTQPELGAELKAIYHIESRQTMTSCTTCHR
jgi:menaquinone reductase, multiheme cytochrome c subunit